MSVSSNHIGTLPHGRAVIGQHESLQLGMSVMIRVDARIISDVGCYVLFFDQMVDFTAARPLESSRIPRAPDRARFQ
jgi:hypothetical protein